MAAFTLLIAPPMLPVTSMTKATSIGPQGCWGTPLSDPPPPPSLPDEPPSGPPGVPGLLAAPASTTERSASPAHRAPAHGLRSLLTCMAHPAQARCLQGASPGGRPSFALGSRALAGLARPGCDWTLPAL